MPPHRSSVVAALSHAAAPMNGRGAWAFAYAQFAAMSRERTVVKELSADGNWYRLVERATVVDWRTSRPGTHQEHFHFVPDERLELLFETHPVRGFAVWYEGKRVEFVAESRELVPESHLELTRNIAIRWLNKYRPARS